MATKLALTEDLEVTYRLAPHMLVLSHGFGVDRSSNGLFTDIAGALPKGWGYVLFDYNEIKAQAIRVTDFTEQKARLRTVLQWIRKHPDVTSVSLLAHSMGCIVAALQQPKGLRTVIMVAPPTKIGDNTRAYFTGKEGALKENDIWTVPRRSGKLSIIPESLFDEFEQTNAEEALLAYAALQPYTLVIAGADEVLTDADYTKLLTQPNVTSLTIDGANHDFVPPRRAELLTAIRQHIT